LQIAGFVLEKQAHKPVVLDMTKVSHLCDYFVICSTETNTQVEGIHQWVEKRCAENNIIIHRWEHDEASRWVLVDLFDVVLHIFIDEAREFYNLENLWSQAKKVRISTKKK